MMALLAGFMAGSLPKLWPWRISAESSLVEQPVMPALYSQQTGEAAMVLPALLAVAAGVLVVWLLSRHQGVHNEASIS